MLHTNESKVFRYIFFEMYPKLQVFFLKIQALLFINTVEAGQAR